MSKTKAIADVLQVSVRVDKSGYWRIVRTGQSELNMGDISVIICTHNPNPDYLRRVLDGLRSQTLPRSYWELLMVDNGSRERLADSWDVSWHGRARHLREDTIGLTHARSRGISEATGDLLVFVDDDNVIAPDYLEEAWTLHRKNPHLGVFGAGVLDPAFEIEPSDAIKIHLGMLALRSVSSNLWSNNIKDTEVIPWGAGLCVRRGLAKSYQQFLESLDTHIAAVLGRRGKELFTGDDNVFSWIAVSGGLGFGIFPALRVTHLIAASRVAPAYIVKLIAAHTLSSDVLHYTLAGRKSAPGRLGDTCPADSACPEQRLVFRSLSLGGAIGTRQGRPVHCFPSTRADEYRRSRRRWPAGT